MLLISLVIPLRKNVTTSEIELWGQIRDTQDELYQCIEFPGGKIECSESPENAAIREVLEEVDISLSNSEIHLGFIHKTPKIQFYVFLSHREFPKTKGQYFSFGQFLESNIPPANKDFLRKYKTALVDYLSA